MSLSIHGNDWYPVNACVGSDGKRSRVEATIMVHNLLHSIAGKSDNLQSEAACLETKFGAKDLQPVFSSQSRSYKRSTKARTSFHTNFANNRSQIAHLVILFGKGLCSSDASGFSSCARLDHRVFSWPHQPSSLIMKAWKLATVASLRRIHQPSAFGKRELD